MEIRSLPDVIKMQNAYDSRCYVIHMTAKLEAAKPR